MTELQQARYDWRSKIAKILRNFLSEHPISEDFIHSDVSQEFFEDSCQFSALRYDISELISTLENINKYAKIYE